MKHTQKNHFRKRKMSKRNFIGNQIHQKGFRELSLERKSSFGNWSCSKNPQFGLVLFLMMSRSKMLQITIVDSLSGKCGIKIGIIIICKQNPLKFYLKILQV